MDDLGRRQKWEGDANTGIWEFSGCDYGCGLAFWSGLGLG
jgi:hypothetical protein